MKYLIMLGIVIMMAAADFVTGFIKANVLGNVSSKTMRTGGLKKFAEIVVMVVSIALEIALRKLGTYYDNCEQLSALIGLATTVMVFAYITIMEFISILENYLAVCPEAVWAERLLKKLKNVDGITEKEEG
jgi:toxin secretion/phage lysis holin